jgi:hypothetical protein
MYTTSRKNKKNKIARHKGREKESPPIKTHQDNHRQGNSRNWGCTKANACCCASSLGSRVIVEETQQRKGLSILTTMRKCAQTVGVAPRCLVSGLDQRCPRVSCHAFAAVSRCEENTPCLRSDKTKEQVTRVNKGGRQALRPDRMQRNHGYACLCLGSWTQPCREMTTV